MATAVQLGEEVQQNKVARCTCKKMKCISKVPTGKLAILKFPFFSRFSFNLLWLHWTIRGNQLLQIDNTIINWNVFIDCRWGEELAATDWPHTARPHLSHLVWSLFGLASSVLALLLLGHVCFYSIFIDIRRSVLHTHFTTSRASHDEYIEIYN